MYIQYTDLFVLRQRMAKEPMIRVLIEAGADVNAQGGLYGTAPVL